MSERSIRIIGVLGNQKLCIGQTSWCVELVLEASGDLLDHLSVVRADLTEVLELKVREVVAPVLWLQFTAISVVVRAIKLRLALLSVDTSQLIELKVVVCSISFDVLNILASSLGGDARPNTIILADIVRCATSHELNNGKVNLAIKNSLPVNAACAVSGYCEFLGVILSGSSRRSVVKSIASNPFVGIWQLRSVCRSVALSTTIAVSAYFLCWSFRLVSKCSERACDIWVLGVVISIPLQS